MSGKAGKGACGRGRSKPFGGQRVCKGCKNSSWLRVSASSGGHREETVVIGMQHRENEFASGLKWEKLGLKKPTSGYTIRNAALEAALRQKGEDAETTRQDEFSKFFYYFGKDEFHAFNMPDLSLNGYVEVDGNYFKPCADEVRIKVYTHQTLSGLLEAIYHDDDQDDHEELATAHEVCV